MSNLTAPNSLNAPRKCPHEWESVSMVFETQILDGDGRVRIRQPDLDEGRVYFICRLCACHTYMTTQWIGWRMYGSEDAIRSTTGYGVYSPGVNRDEWEPTPDE